jgi:hypothetical protein
MIIMLKTKIFREIFPVFPNLIQSVKVPLCNMYCCYTLVHVVGEGTLILPK